MITRSLCRSGFGDRGRSRSVLSLSSPATTLAEASLRAVTITACVLPASPRRSTLGGWSACCAPRCSGRHSSSTRSEEHTSELQSRLHLVCRLLLEKKKKKKRNQHTYSTLTRTCTISAHI